MSKSCSMCGQFLPLNDFYRVALHKDGKSSQCKKCASKDKADKALSEKEKKAENNRLFSSILSRKWIGKSWFTRC